MMSHVKQIAKHFRDVHFGGNWTAVNLKDTLEGITWEQAAMKVHHLNSIGVLVFHINYYVSAILKVLEGGPLNASDKLSFNLPALTSENDWQQLVAKTLEEATALAQRIEALDDAILWENFAGTDKYGSYYRNLLGVIEHTHYHLGQIAVIKKMITVTTL